MENNLLKIEKDLEFLQELISDKLSSKSGFWFPNQSEFIRMWSLYNDLRKNLIDINSEFFTSLREIPLPDPSKNMSIYPDGYYSRSHIEPLNNETILALQYFNAFKKSVPTQKKVNDPLSILWLLSSRFTRISKQLISRRGNRSTLHIDDEYDVQDLLHSLLTIYFDDIRDEEWTPSYAGSSSRMDFLLKQEQIVVECKKTRKGLSRKEVGEQLIIDSEKYKRHPDCKTLFCFVYDPEQRISNPRGLETDLSKSNDDFSVIVSIEPKY
ncbi:MAG: hypothetical protein PHP42_08670 [Bacteroidota bacterium]|nr:hypothetical protein [Bacteroidota bacterium]